MHATISISGDLVSCDLNAEAVVLNLRSGRYYGLDPVGARIWNLIQTPRTVQEIRDILLQDYEVEPDRCEGDLVALLEKLANEGLVDV
ncbi:MAG: thymidylate synthase, partial [Gemmatimonadetes bacterium RIFCSPLOWO2_02_FULL_71_11]